MATRSLARSWILAALAVVVALGALVLLPAPSADGAFSASLVCEPAFKGAFCEARPYNSTYTYEWSNSGAVYFPNGCSTAFCDVACFSSGSGGTVTVKITAPDGFSDTASKGIYCGSPY